MSQNVIIGVLGGMGPDATVDLFKKIIRNTSAAADQEHLRVIIDNNPKIPDRTKAILEGGPSPKEALSETARNLERAGAGLVIIPCNTAHYWIADIQRAVRIPVLDMLDETTHEITSKHPSVKRVGLLASTGTVQAGLYQNRLKRFAMETIVPIGPEQRSVMDVIYSVKSGNFGVKQNVLKITSSLIERGAQLLIAGCTEIPLVLEQGDVSVPLIDSTEILARKAVVAAGGKLTGQS